jgi:hypothetical protein
MLEIKAGQGLKYPIFTRLYSLFEVFGSWQQCSWMGCYNRKPLLDKAKIFAFSKFGVLLCRNKTDKSYPNSASSSVFAHSTQYKFISKDFFSIHKDWSF